MGTAKFWIVSFIVSLLFLVLTRWLFTNEYYFFAAYQVLQFIVLATAWNILGGYTGYTNFGTGAFFAVGAYSAVVLHKLTSLPLPVMMLVGGVTSGIVGFGVGYLSLRLRGVVFAIARPMERSTLGLGFNAIRDDEQAAEAAGVPTLRLKLISTTLSGALMGMSGAPLPYYVTYLDPASSFNLSYAVNSVAMPMIGGMTSWIGPVIGAVLLGTIQQLATVTISSALNLLIVGVLLIVFVVIAPNGIVGLVQSRRRARLR